MSTATSHFGFHSRASFCASATSAGVIFVATKSRFPSAGGELIHVGERFLMYGSAQCLVRH
jgi:hypothetical protein